MSAYPVLYQADYVERRSRLTTFFRYLLAIPHAIVLALLGIAAAFSITGAWFAVVLTGRYPQGLYDFHTGLLRWYARFNAYYLLQVDPYPPFAFGDAPGYPVRVQFAGPLPQYSRAKAFFRLLLAIPLFIVSYVMNLVAGLCAIAAWFVGVILGRQPRGLFEALDFALSYNVKGAAYLLLMTETYPPFSNEHAELEPVGEATTLEPPSSASGYAPPASAAFGVSERPGGLEG